MAKPSEPAEEREFGFGNVMVLGDIRQGYPSPFSHIEFKYIDIPHYQYKLLNSMSKFLET